MQLFEQLGYEECISDELEHEFEKIAVYARLGKGQHVARQLDDGLWTSKLGDLEDITHSLRGLEGTEYGKVEKIMKSKIP